TIVARAGLEAVAAALAVELIVAVAADEDVVALAAQELVVAGAAVQRVCARAVLDDVASPTAENGHRDGHIVVDRALVVAVAEIDVDRTRGGAEDDFVGVQVAACAVAGVVDLVGPIGADGDVGGARVGLMEDDASVVRAG